MVVTEELAELLAALCRAPGLSGREEPARQVFLDAARPLCDAVQLDPLGNAVAWRRAAEPPTGAGTAAAGARESLLIAAHADEIGFLVTAVEKGGFLRVRPVGGVDPKTVLGQAVLVHGRARFRGVIGAKPPHFTTEAEREKPVPVEELFVDTGLPEEQVREAIPPGSAVTFAGEPRALLDGRFAGRSLDNRAGVAAAVECLRRLAGRPLAVDLYVVATVQEELGFRGASAVTYRLRPSAGLAVDVTFARQPGVSEAEGVELGGGPAVAVGPVIHPAVYRRLVEVAGAAGIPYQVEAAPRHTGTDAAAIQISRAGVPAGVVSVPMRSMHAPAGVVALADVEATGRLLAEFAAGLTPGWLEEVRDGGAAGSL